MSLQPEPHPPASLRNRFASWWTVLWLAMALWPAHAHAQSAPLVFIAQIEIEWYDDVTLAGHSEGPIATDASSALAVFGPFRVVDSHTAEMHGVVDGNTPAQFVAMRAAFPDIATLRMVECPGSEDEAANLVLARMVRAARIDTLVPQGCSVRSGAVELFLAGVRRQADSRAEFAVHSWRDELGREADDFAADDPVHGEYMDFYREMGIGEDKARTFYALTSSVSFDDALYLAPLQLAQLGLLDIL